MEDFIGVSRCHQRQVFKTWSMTVMCETERLFSRGFEYWQVVRRSLNLAGWVRFVRRTRWNDSGEMKAGRNFQRVGTACEGVSWRKWTGSSRSCFEGDSSLYMTGAAIAEMQISLRDTYRILLADWGVSQLKTLLSKVRRHGADRCCLVLSCLTPHANA